MENNGVDIEEPERIIVKHSTYVQLWEMREPKEKWDALVQRLIHGYNENLKAKQEDPQK
jgi:hypothetical protein